MICHQNIAVNQAAMAFGDLSQLLEVTITVGWAMENYLTVIAADNYMLGHAANVVTRLSRQGAGVRSLSYSLVFCGYQNGPGKRQM
jgi:hypothetical protein